MIAQEHVTVHQSANNRWQWVHKRPGTGMSGYSNETFESDFDAVAAALDIARFKGLVVRVPQDVLDRYVTMHRTMGINMYRNDVDFSSCTNTWQRQGWEAAYNDDVHPLAMRGWPMGVEQAYAEVA